MSIAEILKSIKTIQKYVNEATPQLQLTGAYTLPMQTIPVYDQRPRHIWVGEPRPNYNNILSPLFFLIFSSPMSIGSIKKISFALNPYKSQICDGCVRTNEPDNSLNFRSI